MTAGGASGHTAVAAAPSRLTAARVWRFLDKASFAVLSHVTPAGTPRGTGVVYAAERGRIYVAIAPDSWKARHIAEGDEVGLTVLVPRGGILALVAPIPPATISFPARVTARLAGQQVSRLSTKLAHLLPHDRRSAAVLELLPIRAFLTYGVGVRLDRMAKPELARARVVIDAR